MTTEPVPPFDLDAVFEVDDYLYFYEDDLTDERSEAEVALLVRLLDLETPQKILDLACGFGRHANRLARLGHSVTGVDWMPGFLDLARQQAAAWGVTVDYRQGDMRRIALVEDFDRVLLFFTSFGYFDDDENARVLRNMARALKPGGRLGIDLPNRDVIALDPPGCSVIDKGGDLMINRLSFDPLTARFHNERIVVRHGQRKDKPFSIRMYSPAEIGDLLRDAGLEDIQCFDGGGEPLAPDARRMIVTAQKPLRG
jgi:SAM-dependent methyltransferase